MSEAEARRIAEAAREAHKVPPAARATAAERRYIELAGPDPGVPGPVRDVLVWIVHFEHEGRWVELAVDDRAGEVVRVERSR